MPDVPIQASWAYMAEAGKKNRRKNCDDSFFIMAKIRKKSNERKIKGA
jgi:hypothetical protein